MHGLGDADGGQALLHGDDVGALLAQHGVAERLVLDAQRLGLGDRVADHVALGDAAERRDRVPLGRDLRRWRRRSGRRSGCRRRSAPLAGDDGDPLLERGQPVHQVVDDHAVAQRRRPPRPGPRARGRLVRGARRHRACTAAGSPTRSGRCRGWPRSLTTPTSAIRAGNGPCRRVIDLVDLAELAGLQPRRAAAAAPGCTARCARRRRPGPRPRTPRASFSRRRGVLRQRLLDQGVHAGLGQRQPDLLVVDRRHRDHAVVDPGLDQLPRRDSSTGRPPATPCGSPPGSATATRSTPSSDREHPGVVAAHHAQPDQAGAQVRHHAPAFARALTAVDDPLEVALRQRRVHRQRQAPRAPPARSPAGRRRAPVNGGSRWFGIG